MFQHMTGIIPTFLRRFATFNWIPMFSEVLGLRLQLSWKDKVLMLVLLAFDLLLFMATTS